MTKVVHCSSVISR